VIALALSAPIAPTGMKSKGVDKFNEKFPNGDLITSCPSHEDHSDDCVQTASGEIYESYVEYLDAARTAEEADGFALDFNCGEDAKKESHDLFIQKEFNGDHIAFVKSKESKFAEAKDNSTHEWPVPCGSCPASFNTPCETPSADLEKYVLPVHFHVLHCGASGKIKESCIQDQVDLTNKNFLDNGLNVQLTLQGASYVNDCAYHNNEGNFVDELSLDPLEVINVWVNTAGGYLGYTYLPTSSAKYEGIWLAYAATGGEGCATYSDYDEGDTLTHELGHFLGLEHTFGRTNGGVACPSDHPRLCNITGDLICDTNAEIAAHYGCGDANTCNQDKADPINNIMDYSDDRCMWELTDEQGKRVRCSIETYRKELPCGYGQDHDFCDGTAASRSLKKKGAQSDNTLQPSR